ncbi:hypothetical protein BH10PLA1_BH10PLA1_07700 [soil metagenome]
MLVTITLLTHGRDLFHDFLEWDDQELIARNLILNPVTPAHFKQMWTSPVQGLYTPLAYTAWAGVAAIARTQTPDSHGATLSPLPFHALNLLLHVGCVLVVFDVLLLLLPRPGGERAGVRGETQTDELRPTSQTPARASRETDRGPDSERLAPPLTSLLRGEGPYLAAAMGAALFALHPIQVEAVAWISGMNNVLAAFFSLLCIAAYIRFAQATPSRRVWYVVAMVALLLAMLSKPTAIATPVMLLAIDAMLLRGPIRRVLVTLLPMAILVVPFIIIGRAAQPSMDVFVPPIGQRFLVAADTIGFYLQKLVFPNALLMDYSRTPQWVIAHRGAWPVAIVALLIAIAASRRWPWVLGTVAVLIAGFCIVLGLVPFSFQSTSTVADRYLYLAMLGPAILVAIALSRVTSVNIIGWTGACVMAFGMLSFLQGGLWQDTITLCSYTIEHNPRTLAARSAIGAAYRNRGDFTSAEKNYQDALAIDPGDFVTNYNYGNLLLESQPVTAIERYRAVTGPGATDPRLRRNLCYALFKTGKIDEAVDVYRVVLRMNPADASANINLGYCLATRGEFDEAERCFRQALADEPDSVLARKALDKLAAVRAAVNR